jgi:hypothetical protein
VDGKPAVVRKATFRSIGAIDGTGGVDRATGMGYVRQEVKILEERTLTGDEKDENARLGVGKVKRNLVKGKRRIQSDGLVQTRIKSFFTNSIQIRGPEDGHRVENIVTLPGVNLNDGLEFLKVRLLQMMTPPSPGHKKQWEKASKVPRRNT